MKGLSKEVLLALRAAKAMLRRDTGPHYVYAIPGASELLVLSKSASDKRARQNQLSQIRRFSGSKVP